MSSKKPLAHKPRSVAKKQKAKTIVEEVEKRLRSVKMQAGRARTYQEHSQRLSELRLTHAIQEYHTHQDTDLLRCRLIRLVPVPKS